MFYQYFYQLNLLIQSFTHTFKILLINSTDFIHFELQVVFVILLLLFVQFYLLLQLYLKLLYFIIVDLLQTLDGEINEMLILVDDISGLKLSLFDWGLELVGILSDSLVDLVKSGVVLVFVSLVDDEMVFELVCQFGHDGLDFVSTVLMSRVEWVESGVDIVTELAAVVVTLV